MRRGIGAVPKGLMLFPDLTVAENLIVGGYIHTRHRADASRARLLELFPRLGERLHQ